MELRFSRNSLREVNEAVSYYEAEVDGLGKAFLTVMRDAIAEVVRYPKASRVIRGDYRRKLVARFPYGIIYRIEGETIFVAAVMHLKRKPGYWKEE